MLPIIEVMSHGSGTGLNLRGLLTATIELSVASHELSSRDTGGKVQDCTAAP